MTIQSSARAFALFTAETADIAGNKPAYAESTVEGGVMHLACLDGGVHLHALSTGKRDMFSAHQWYIRAYSMLVNCK